MDNYQGNILAPFKAINTAIRQNKTNKKCQQTTGPHTSAVVAEILLSLLSAAS
jgi:hypothetical protein